MYCGNCGGEITDKDAYCPYCGVMNVRAAETEYMEKLEDIRENTEKLGDEGGRHTKKEVRRVGRLAVIIFAIVAVLVLGLFVFSWAMDHFFYGNGRDARDEAAFKEKYFPKLEELYASGDMDATCDYLNEIGGEDGAEVLQMWPHYKYISYYMDYKIVHAIPGTELDNDFWNLKYDEVLYAGIELIYQAGYFGQKNMSAEETEKVKKYASEAEDIFSEYFSLDKSELDEIYRNCTDEEGYVYYTKIQEWAKKTGGAK
ncbi:MAG: hypothetical protein IKG01_03795 [Lachnospiraceae bacterium]|jgi:hypothetical protein|nr:hypothetical protein [Lachnospiraceae bacterium]